MCCILICISNIDPLAALIGDSEYRKNSKERVLRNEDKMLRILLNLFSFEGNLADIELRHLAEEHYIKCFGGYH